MITSDSLSNIAPALVKAQEAVQVAKKDSRNPSLNNQYASLDSVLLAIKPALVENGLVMIQSPTIARDGYVGIVTRVLHESGEWIEDQSEFMVEEGNRGTNGAQQAGIVITYQRRYAAAAFFGVVTDADTDGAMVQRKPAPKKKPAAKKAPPKPAVAQAMTGAGYPADIGVVVAERTAVEFWPTVKAGIERYDTEAGLLKVQAAAKKLGYTAIPGTPDTRADMAREIAAYASYRGAGMAGDLAAQSVIAARGKSAPQPTMSFVEHGEATASGAFSEG